MTLNNDDESKNDNNMENPIFANDTGQLGPLIRKKDYTTNPFKFWHFP